MKKNEIKRTRTIEEVVRTEWIADDGEIFYNENECKKYEESARFVLSKKLKRIVTCRADEINYDASDECNVEIYNIQTQEDLDNLKRWLYLKLKDCAYSHCKYEDIEEKMKNVTTGHEVIIQYYYDDDGFWIAGNGSIEDYGNHFKDLCHKVIKREQEKNVNE